jgi:hypothetical protein
MQRSEQEERMYEEMDQNDEELSDEDLIDALEKKFAIKEG